jgi:hypothetical protein
MADLQKKPEATEAKPEVKAMESGLQSRKKIGLVEMMLILMLVGLVFIFIFPLQQLKVDKAQEQLVQQKVSPIFATFDRVVEAMEQYRANDPFGEYPFTIEELNLTNMNTDDFKFEYDSENKNVIAKTTEAFGKAGIGIVYNLEAKSYTLDDPAPDKKPIIKEDLLP